MGRYVKEIGHLLRWSTGRYRSNYCVFRWLSPLMEGDSHLQHNSLTSTIPWLTPTRTPISFTYPPVASMWVVTLHNLFLYSDPPLPCQPPSYWLRLFSSQTFSCINTPTFLNLLILHTYPPMKMEQTECSETSPYKIHMPGNYPEESMQHSEHGKILNQEMAGSFEHNNSASGAMNGKHASYRALSFSRTLSCIHLVIKTVRMRRTSQKPHLSELRP
jgi:hypothetical protein